MADELVARWKRWLEHTGYDGGVNSPPMLVLERIQSDAAEIARLKAELAEARGNVTALETSLHAHNCGTPGCLCISTSIRDLARAGDPESPE